MKLRAHREGLAVVAIALTAAIASLTRDTIVAIAGDRTVKPAVAGDIAIGRLSVAPHADTKKCTVETRFKELIEITASGAVVAGDRLKMAAPAGDGTQRMMKLADADSLTLMTGIAWSGGADGATVEALTY